MKTALFVGLGAWSLVYSFQSSLTVTCLRSSRENSNILWPHVSLFHHLSTPGPPPCHEFPTTIHSASVFGAPLMMSRTLSRAGDSMESNLQDRLPSLPCLPPTSPKMNPWEQTGSSSASCSSKRETAAEAQLEVEDSAQGPAGEQASTYTDAGRGRKGWTGNMQTSLTFLSFLILCSWEGRKQRPPAELEKSKLRGLTWK